MLPSDKFSNEMWDLVESSGGDKNKLREKLVALPRDVFVVCYKEFYRAMRTLWDTFDASGYLDLSTTNDEQISEDGKQDIYSYVVSQGRSYYNEIALHPERLRTDIDADDVFFAAIPGQVFWERFGEEIIEQ